MFARYYVLDQLFAGAAYQLDGDEYFSLSAGYNYFPTDKVSLEPTFIYPFDDFLDPEIRVGISIFLD